MENINKMISYNRLRLITTVLFFLLIILGNIMVNLDRESEMDKIVYNSFLIVSFLTIVGMIFLTIKKKP